MKLNVTRARASFGWLAGVTELSAFAEVQAALERGDHADVLRRTEAILAERPGDDATHEVRARALLALGRLDEAEREVNDAVRLDPDEIRYRELLAEVLAERGAHRDAAVEFGRLARNDPRSSAWTLAEARERLGAAQPEMGVEAARRAVRLNPADAAAQLALAQGLARVGDASGAIQAATRAAALAPGDPMAREALADARWLGDDVAAAFAEFRALAGELEGGDVRRITRKALLLYRQHARGLGAVVARVPALFNLAFRNGWVHVR
jgi:predicted Zn-dependent protease